MKPSTGQDRLERFLLRILVDAITSAGAPSKRESVPAVLAAGHGRTTRQRQPRGRFTKVVPRREWPYLRQDNKLAEQSGGSGTAIDNRLTGFFRSVRSTPLARQVEDASIAAEISLRSVLIESSHAPDS